MSKVHDEIIQQVTQEETVGQLIAAVLSKIDINETAERLRPIIESQIDKAVQNYDWDQYVEELMLDDENVKELLRRKVVLAIKKGMEGGDDPR